MSIAVIFDDVLNEEHIINIFIHRLHGNLFSLVLWRIAVSLSLRVCWPQVHGNIREMFARNYRR